jgi:hypothetical protein
MAAPLTINRRTVQKRFIQNLKFVAVKCRVSEINLPTTRAQNSQGWFPAWSAQNYATYPELERRPNCPLSEAGYVKSIRHARLGRAAFTLLYLTLDCRGGDRQREQCSDFSPCRRNRP